MGDRDGGRGKEKEKGETREGERPKRREAGKKRRGGFPKEIQGVGLENIGNGQRQSDGLWLSCLSPYDGFVR